MCFQPAVCTRELCVFSFYTLGVMAGATDEVATGAEVGNIGWTHGTPFITGLKKCVFIDLPELSCHPSQMTKIRSIVFVRQVVDLLVAMCRAALQSSRKSIIFEPYPTVIDPYNPKSLAFSPKVQYQLNCTTIYDLIYNGLIITLFFKSAINHVLLFYDRDAATTGCKKPLTVSC